MQLKKGRARRGTQSPTIFSRIHENSKGLCNFKRRPPQGVLRSYFPLVSIESGRSRRWHLYTAVSPFELHRRVWTQKNLGVSVIYHLIEVIICTVILGLRLMYDNIVDTTWYRLPVLGICSSGLCVLGVYEQDRCNAVATNKAVIEGCGELVRCAYDTNSNNKNP